MNDSLIRRFCETRHRWPIVATATALLALATVWPSVDDYFDKQSSRSELSEDLVHARLTAATLPAFEKRVAAVRVELEALEVRSVEDGSLARFRSRLVDLVRESGCQIRRIEVGAPTLRAWKQGDNPLDETASPKPPTRRSSWSGIASSLPSTAAWAPYTTCWIAWKKNRYCPTRTACNCRRHPMGATR